MNYTFDSDSFDKYRLQSYLLIGLSVLHMTQMLMQTPLFKIDYPEKFRENQGYVSLTDSIPDIRHQEVYAVLPMRFNTKRAWYWVVMLGGYAGLFTAFFIV